MKKAFLLVTILFVSVLSTACINNFAVQELNNKAKGYLEQGDYESAISRLKSSIDLDNTIFETHYNLGIAYTQAEKYPEAVDSFESAIKLKPNFADSYYSLAVARENFAKGIIDGSISATNQENNEKAKTEESPDILKPDNNENTAKNKDLSVIEKDKIVQLFNGAVDAYSQYLDKSTTANDKDEVNQKIDYLKSQIEKYNDPSIQE